MEMQFLIPVFGTLLGMEYAPQIKLFSRKSETGILFWESFHLVWQVLLIILLYHFIFIEWLSVPDPKEWLTLSALPMAYGLGLIRQRTRSHTLAVFAVVFASLRYGSNWTETFYAALYFGSGVLLFFILFSGIAEKIRLSKMPHALEGAPSGMMVAMILSLVLTFFQGFLAGL